MNIQIPKPVELLVVAALLFSAVQPAARGQNLPCWIKRVEERNGNIYILFDPDYRQWARIKTRSQARHDETSSSGKTDYLVMWEGETASIGNNLHSGCEITVERHERQLGVRTEAYDNLQGLPSSNRTYFIEAELSNALQQPK